VIVLLLVAALKTSRLGYESPQYEVVEEDGKFELRRYAGFRTVTATMTGTSEMNRGFGRLFKYITGDNEKQQKMAMTVPVLMTEDEATSEDPQSATMSFVIPSEVADKGAPEPKGKNVALTETSAGEFAVLRFDGFRKGNAIKAAEEKLRAWVEQQGWNVSGEPMVAYYDPPWTPGLLRRNEVLIPVKR
jgi:DNA gyrase inhibitor GyrI